MKKTSQRPLGIYVHIPFCRSKCDYCDFYSLPGQDQGLMDQYQAALLQHLAETAAVAKGYQVDTIYFGGGTPSWYGEKRLIQLLKGIYKGFDVAKDCEITMEANPDSVDKKMLTRLRWAGVNRLSLGVQSACDAHLAALHRPHTFAQVTNAVENARSAKLDNLSLDLIYGLPGQSMEDWQRTVEEALALAPEHLSCYGLKVEEGTPLYLRREQESFPDDDTQADQYLWMVERLAKAGYEQYEISNFAKPGRESRHNLRYWTLSEYAGFGPGAHSDFGGWRYGYVRDIQAYIHGIQTGGGGLLSESEQISQRERGSEYLMLGLRTAHGIDETTYTQTYFMNFLPVQQRLQQYKTHGWAVEQDGRWRFTPEGFLLSNQLIGGLLEVQEESSLKTILEYNARKQES